MTHRIHVWYFFLHLPEIYAYAIHGWYGVWVMISWWFMSGSVWWIWPTSLPILSQDGPKSQLWSTYNTPEWGQITPHIPIDKAIYRGPHLFHPMKITCVFWGPIQTRCCTTWCWSIPSWPPRNWASKLALLPPIRAQAFAMGWFFWTNQFGKSVPNTAGGERFFKFFINGTYTVI